LALHKAGRRGRHKPSPSGVPAGQCRLGFSVPNLDAFHQELTAKGVACLKPPAMQNFGARLAEYADPDGLPLSVSETPRRE
jgi:catechol 2,3-dioxygenase-like lactoylglutathione lyase family enzyme